MSDKHEDDGLATIRDHVRAERAGDAALEAVARGEVAAESQAVAELEERAAGDAEIAAMIEASRPLGADAEARIAARLAKAIARPTATAKPAQNAKVLPFMRRAAAYAGPLTLAAAVLLYVTMGGKGDAGRAMLPDYSVVASGDKEMRGPEGAPSTTLLLRGGHDAGFEIVLRPATAAGKKVVAYVFAMGQGGMAEREPNPVDATVDIAAEGSVRIRGRARALDGAREVRVVLGTAGESITRFEDALSRARDGKSDAQVRVLVVRIDRR